MKYMDLFFNDDFINNLKTKLPNEISSLDFDIKNYRGVIKFKNDSLDAVFIYIVFKSEETINNILFKSDVETMLKFEYIDNDFVYKYIYSHKDVGEDHEPIQYRYDVDMNVDSTYYLEETTELMKKDKDQAHNVWYRKNEGDSNYDFDKYDWDVLNKLHYIPSYFEALHSLNIIDINGNDELTENDKNSCFYSRKIDNNSIYIQVGKYNECNTDVGLEIDHERTF